MSDLSRVQISLQDCTVVILAGGLGTRLRSVVSDRPKPLAEVNGRPFMTYLLDQLADTGLKRVVLCTGYRGEMVEAVLGHRWRSLELIYSQELVPLGTGGALRLAIPQIHSEIALVMNGDSYCEIDLQAFWQYHQLHPQDCTIALTQMQDVQRFGQVKLNSRNQIIQFGEKDKVSEPGWINAGIYLLNISELQAMPEQQYFSLEMGLFVNWVTRGQLWGFVTPGLFIDIGLSQSYERAQSLFNFYKSENLC
ncbi:MAG: nucleotidyltransferase family protein [Cyanobacteria bacterium P01_G01_bin.54]